MSSEEKVAKPAPKKMYSLVIPKKGTSGDTGSSSSRKKPFSLNIPKKEVDKNGKIKLNSLKIPKKENVPDKLITTRGNRPDCLYLIFYSHLQLFVSQKMI